MGLKKFFEDLSSSPTLLPSIIPIAKSNVLFDTGTDGLGVFTPHEHYFTVQVNEMFLSSERQWFRAVEPMVACLTSYDYGVQSQVENPFVVGRSLIKNKIDIPDGMLFKDTRVAGIHPFGGGKLVVGLVLCEIQSRDYLKDSLEFLEKISGVFGESMRLLANNYLKVAGVVINGIDNLFNIKEVQPLMGIRMELDADKNNGFSAGYYLLLDKRIQNINPENFFVKEDGLYYGESREKLVKFHKARDFPAKDYILFSILKSDARSDYKTLPVYQFYNKILDQIKASGEVSEELKNTIKRMLKVLNIEMKQSPDLTEPHAQVLMSKFIAEVKKLIDDRFNFAAAGKEDENSWAAANEKIDAL